MSLVTTLVFLAQATRRLSSKLKAKAIKEISIRIEKVEAEQVKQEAHRSNLLIDLHSDFYAADAKLEQDYIKALKALDEEFAADQDKLASDFNEHKRTITLTTQAASNQLKSELSALRSELDHLIK